MLPPTEPNDRAKDGAPVAVLAVDTPEAARITGHSESWLAQMRSQGIGPRWCKVGRRALYRVADLEAWLDAHVQETSAA